MASGDVVNTAARLQSAAPVNGILVDETTYRATDQKIDYSESEPVTAKGKQEPVPAWEVIDARSSYGVDVGQVQRAPLIGREREVGVLVGALERVRAERSPQLVTLVGVPGIGKSRLVYELSAGDRERGRADQLASGPITPLRRRRLLLGAIRDGQGASRDPRDRLVGGDGEQARSQRPGARRPVGGGMGRAAPRHADRASRANRTCEAIIAPRPLPPGGGSSRGSQTNGRSSWCSRTCTGPTTDSSTSSTTSSTGLAACRSSSSARRARSCCPGGRAGAEESRTR